MTPLQFFLNVMQDPNAPIDVRVRVARATAPLVHGKLGSTSSSDRPAKALMVGGPDGLSIDIAEARALLDQTSGLEVILGTLGLKIILIEDEAATARTLALRKQADASQQRFGNKSRRSSKIEHVEKPAKLPAPQRNEPPALSRAHLRVIQKCRKYG